jgi:hypothetical protein
MKPSDLAAVVSFETATLPVVVGVVASHIFPVVALGSLAALADGTATTESSPAPSADTATSAMRLRSVFVDMFFLSLVRFRNFLDLARRSFDLLIPLLL